MSKATTRLSALVGLALAGTAVLVAWQDRQAAPVPTQMFGKQLPPGTRVAVVAYHDSRLLTMCPVAGKSVIESTFYDQKEMPSVKARFYYSPTGSLTVDVYDPVLLHKTNERTFARLPLPAAWTAGLRPTPLGRPSFARGATRSKPLPAFPVPSGTVLDRLAPDPAVQARVEAELKKKGTYVVVDSPSDAEYVLVVESGYTSMAAGVADQSSIPPSLRRPPAEARGPERIVAQTEGEFYARSLEAWHDPFFGLNLPPPLRPRPASPPAPPPAPVHMSIGGDLPSNWREWSLALAVPAGTFQRHAGDAAGLTAARVWEGFAFQQMPRMGTVEARAASPEALADDFSDTWRKDAAGLPLCAASSRVILMPNEERRAVAATPPVEPAERVSPSNAQFRASTILVAVPLTVSDARGRPVLDLEPSELHVFEDDIEQKIEAFAPVTAGTHVALLVDTSSSMRFLKGETAEKPPPADPWRANGRLLSAAQAFIDRLRPDDQVLLASFASRIRVNTEWTADRALLRQALAQLVTGEATRLYDGITLVAADRLAALDERKALVLFTDGVDTRSQLADETTALNAVDRTNTQVYVVRYETADSPPFARLARDPAVRQWLLVPDGWYRNASAYAEADAFLASLAGVTGGRTYVAPPEADLSDVFGEIDNELSRQYTLSFYSSNARFDGAYREIRVTVDRPDHAVHARKGYRAPAARPATK